MFEAENTPTPTRRHQTPPAANENLHIQPGLAGVLAETGTHLTTWFDSRQSDALPSNEFIHAAPDVPGLWAEPELHKEKQTNRDNNTRAAEAPQQRTFVNLQELELYHTHANVAVIEPASESNLLGSSLAHGEQNQCAASTQDHCRDKGIEIIKQWLIDNASSPYPSHGQQSDLAASSGRSVGQVKTCLTNLRARMLSACQDVHRVYALPNTHDADALFEEPYSSQDFNVSLNPNYDPSTLQATGTSVTTSDSNNPSWCFDDALSGFMPGNDTLLCCALEDTGLAVPDFGQVPQTTISSKRKGKRRHVPRFSSSPRKKLKSGSPQVSGDSSTDIVKPYHCTVCLESFKDVTTWKRHESGVHNHVKSLWTCMLDGVITIGTKCIFCSDIVNSLDHFEQHNLNVCLDKNKPERTFSRKDLLKQHVRHVHLATVNDYTKRGFQPPDRWSEETTSPPNDHALWCGFCQCTFESMAARMNHVAQHFKSGLDMTTWVAVQGL